MGCVYTAKQIVKMLRKAGFFRDHQKGSHLVMLHPDGGVPSFRCTSAT